MNQSISSLIILGLTGLTALVLLADHGPVKISRSPGVILKTMNALSAQLDTKANILFDLNGVLMDTKKTTAAQIIGLIPLIRIFFGKMNPREFFFEYFDSILPRNPNSPYSCDEHGRPTPQLMIDWMSGARSGKDIYQFICHALEHDHVLRKHEKKAIKRFSKMLFGDAELFVKTKRMVKKGVKFVKQCKQQGHRVFIISNWDIDSIEILKREMPEFFELFDGIVISAEVGLLKPDERIFQYTLDTYSLDPLQTILIDDQKENIDGAQRCGIAGIHMHRSGTPLLTKPDWKTTKAEFYAWYTRSYPEWVETKA